MLKKLLIQQLHDHLDVDPTPGQIDLMEDLADFILSYKDKNIFIIKGFAGTGKTTVVNSLVKTLLANGRRNVLLAPTGRAAKVLSLYTSQSAFTIHKKIYRQKSGRDGLGEFVLDRNLHKETWFIIDEASMIGDGNQENNIFGSGNLLADLIEYVFSGEKCRLIFIGDTAQLPPVGRFVSPALDSYYLEGMGLTVNEFILKDVVRQAMDSGILLNATNIRQKIDNSLVEPPSFLLNGYSDIIRISGSEMAENVEYCYQQFGIDNTIVISRSNKQAISFNKGIRNKILWREEELSQGDMLMIVKNNYFWTMAEKSPDFIANGDIARLVRINRYHSEYNYRFADVTLEMTDYGMEIDARIFLDTLFMETASMSVENQKELFYSIMEEYEDQKTKKLKILKTRENPFFNALQVKFAYAVTCHKAQGGQWKAVFVDPGFFRREMISVEYLRWIYTAITRASERLYLVNFPEEFFS